MSESRKDESDTSNDPKSGVRPYEPPRIVWREPYEPVSFGISCAFQQGNPGCNPGPYSG